MFLTELCRKTLRRSESPRPSTRKANRCYLGVEELERREVLDHAAAHMLLDFGTVSSPVAAGYRRVVRQLYTPQRGLGWNSLSGITAVDRQIRNPLTRDFHQGRLGTFNVDLPDGNYTVTATLGDALSPRDRVSIFAEGQRVASNIATPARRFQEVTFRVAVADGQLNLRFVDAGGVTPQWALNALEIEPGLDRILTPQGDQVPDFATYPTVFTVSSGMWSDPSIWSTGEVPMEGDIVAISDETWVTYDIQSADTLHVVSVHSGGALSFQTDVSTLLTVGTLQVMPGGTLLVGTEDDPVKDGVTAEIVIADMPLDPIEDPAQFGTGLIGLGTVHMHGQAKTSFVRLAAEPMAGDTELHLSEPVCGWKPGDRLILPDTRPATLRNDDHQEEFAWIESVSEDGLTVTLSAPLMYAHEGGRDVGGELRYLPHVGNLSRNVIVRSENPSGTRGHVLFTEAIGSRADIHVKFVELVELGRTRVDVRVQAGVNQIGRYVIHAHHLMGKAQVDMMNHLPPPQFSLVGLAIDTSPKWGIAIHDSHFGLVEDNVVYNARGAGIVTEDGSETGNQIIHNFTVRSDGGTIGNANYEPFTDDPPHPADQAFEGAGIWCRGSNNRIADNVAAGIAGSAFGSAGFTIFNINGDELRRIPLFPGASTFTEGEYVLAANRDLPGIAFVNNEAYGGSAGFEFWSPEMLDPDGGHGYDVQQVASWNNAYGLKVHFTEGPLRVDGFEALSQPGYGYYGIVAQASQLQLSNSSLQGFAYGITMSPTGLITIDNVYMKNYLNVEIQHSTVPQDGAQIIFSNTWLEPLGEDPTVIQMSFMPDPENDFVSYLTAPVTVIVNDFNGNPDDDFQLFWAAQAADFGLPYNPDLYPDVMEPGLTNQEHFDRYGTSFAGQLLPMDAVMREGIDGFVLPL